jgi:hypothetical protein
MKQTLLLLLVTIAIFGCKKSKEQGPESDSILGTWQLEMHRADPGDGSGTWRVYDGNPVTITFGADGSFSDSRGNAYNRYSLTGNTITLSNTNNANTFEWLIQERNYSSLVYYLGGFWCGGPTGEKLKRISVSSK